MAKRQRENKIDINIENHMDNITEIHYVWISHGESVTISNQTYSVTDAPEFKNKLYGYAPHDIILHPNHPFIQTLFDQTNGVFIHYNEHTGIYYSPVLREEIIPNHYYNALQSANIQGSQELRPIRFIANPDISGTGVYMGFYRLTSYNNGNLTTLRIMNNDDILRLHGGGTRLLYDDIFKYIKQDIQQLIKEYSSNYLNKETIKQFIHNKIKSISFFSCSYVQDRYRNTGIPPGEVYGRCAHLNIIELDIKPYVLEPVNLNIEGNNSVFYFHYNPQKLPGSWSALAERTDRGCGINLLAYFGILLPETDFRIYKNNVARCLVTCLPGTGQTTWNFVRYLMNYGIKTGRNIPRFSIARFEVIYGLYLAIYNLIRIVESNNQSTVVFVKLLKDETFKKEDGTEIISIPGHFIGISVRIESTGSSFVSSFVIYDPQNAGGRSGYVPNQFNGVATPEVCLTLANSIYEHYGKHFNYVDLILTESSDALILEGVTKFPIDSDHVLDKNLVENYGFYYEDNKSLLKGQIHYSPDGKIECTKIKSSTNTQYLNDKEEIEEVSKKVIVSMYQNFLEKQGVSIPEDQMEQLIFLFNVYGLPHNRELLNELRDKLMRKNLITREAHEIIGIINRSGALAAEDGNLHLPLPGIPNNPVFTLGRSSMNGKKNKKGKKSRKKRGGSKNKRNKRNKKTKRNKKANKKTKRNKKAKRI